MHFPKQWRISRNQSKTSFQPVFPVCFSACSLIPEPRPETCAALSARRFVSHRDHRVFHREHREFLYNTSRLFFLA